MIDIVVSCAFDLTILNISEEDVEELMTKARFGKYNLPGHICDLWLRVQETNLVPEINFMYLKDFLKQELNDL